MEESVLFAVSLAFLLSVIGPSCCRETDHRGDVINAVRCRVRCLSLMQRSLDPEISYVYESVTLLDCLRESECEACLRPCNQPFVSVSLCEEACHHTKLDENCRESCQFLKKAKIVRPGICPATTDAAGRPCIKGCQDDGDCKDRLKCCPDVCGPTCQQPSHVSAGMPDVPDQPSIRERPKAGAVELRWNSVASNNSTPVLYVVDSRWNIGQHESEAEMTPWQQIAQTTGISTVISDITPGHWYQFRVTSVNVFGSQGESQPTRSFTLSREPKKPGPPTNVTEGDTLIMGDKVAVNLHWYHPKKSDLPVSRYKLFWSVKPRNSPSIHVSNHHEFRQVVPGDQMVFQIPDLEADTTYSVQIQAICQYGDVRLKSDKVTLSIITYPLPRHDQRPVGSRTLPFLNTMRSAPTPVAPVELVANQPFFENGTLKANVTWTLPGPPSHGIPEIDRVFVFWSPEACIADNLPDDGLAKVMSGSTQDSFFVVYDLRFDCRYTIRVQSVTNQGVVGVTSHLTIATAPCFETHVVGSVRPDCPNTGRRIPEEPSNVKHTFFISSSNITAKLTWDDPASGNAPISAYRVIWGQMSHNSVMDTSSALTKVLSREAKSFGLSNLHEGTTYLVRVQAMSRGGPGRPASFHFTTPLLQNTPHGAQEKDEEEGEEEEEDEDEDDYIDYNKGFASVVPAPSYANYPETVHHSAPTYSGASNFIETSPYVLVVAFSQLYSYAAVVRH